jgi:hypothetical protein
MLTAEELKQFAKTTLKDETATDADKAAAKKAISRINNHGKITKARPKRPKRKDYESEEAFQLALREFRNILDQAAIEREAGRVLDDPNASVLRRRNARELLYGVEQPADPVKAADSHAPEKPPRSRLGAAELAEEQARARTFLDSIGQPDIQPHVEAPAPNAQEHVPLKAKPQMERWCHVHAVSLDVCRCDAHETCELCLNPRSRCFFPPCQNARRR